MFEASLFWMEVMDKRKIVFKIFLHLAGALSR